MKKSVFLFLSITALFLTTMCVEGKEQKAAYGVVDFSSCINESKYGKQEQDAFKKTQEQLGKRLKEINDELTIVENELENPEVLDSLSPEAIEEKKAVRSSLETERNQLQGQYFQLLQGGQYRVAQVIHDRTAEAAERVRKKLGLPVILRTDVCFAFESGLDLTNQVIAEMDAAFDASHASPAPSAGKSS